LSLDGVRALSVPDLGILLKNKAGRKVLLESRRIGVAGSKKAIVVPLSVNGFRNLKTSHWEYTRRLEIEEKGEGEIGYFHMRAMSASNYAEFVKGYYPVFNRKGLVIDMRQNYGGSIDSWILGRLNRKRWMYWKTRTGRPSANMQYAFNGHMVVLIDAYTISDGEAFSEGFRRLGLGPLIGTKTWGGGIWLRGATRLVDGGMARSPEMGVYAPSRNWIIEGTGVMPDIRVDNLPHQAFLGKDAQLEAAIAYLRKKIKEDPPSNPEAPNRPDKSFRYPGPKK
jgi:tricorn protease